MIYRMYKLHMLAWLECCYLGRESWQLESKVLWNWSDVVDSFPPNRIWLLPNMTMAIQRVYCNRQELPTLPEHQSSLPFHRESVFFICIYAFAFCRSLLIVARFYVSRVCILSLAVDHWLPPRFSFLYLKMGSIPQATYDLEYFLADFLKFHGNFNAEHAYVSH
jgi:hypothetical protein